MPRDTELDRLREAQDAAFQRKQAAYDAMNEVWTRLSRGRDMLDSARAAMQDAYEVQNTAWQNLQRTRDRNGPCIDSLNSRQESAFQNMKDAFDRASAAYDARDGASARSHADDGHRYKQQSQDCVAERRPLVKEIREARERHDSTKPAFQKAKAYFDRGKEVCGILEAEHEQKRAAFQHAKADCTAATKAFKKRLATVKAEQKRKRSDKRSTAERAGVPSIYLDDVWVSRESNGTVSIYFGGVGRSNGPGHGHYVMDRDGNVTYRRDPFDPHGAQNFTDKSDGWDPRTVGTVEGHTVTFRTGYGRNEGHTLIADDERSGKAFDGRREHDHYGDKREAPGRVEDDGGDRGHYTGPGSH